jgi:Site-specific DNA methylase
MQTFVRQPTVTPINTQIATRHKKLCEGTGLGVGAEGDAAYTLQEAHAHAVFINHCLNPWDTQQARISVPEGIAPTLAGADGGGGRNPAGLVLSAGFCAGAAPSAGGIGWQEECAPTLKAAESGTNMVPSVLCLSEQEHNRQPLVLATQQGGAEIGVGICPTITSAAGTSGNNGPVLFDNHARDCRYNGPLDVAPTITQMYGTGWNSQPLVAQAAETICIAGNIIDRQPQNGGNGMGYQPDICYTITATDKHAIYQDVVGALCRGDEKGIGNQYVNQDKCIIQPGNLIRRLTPLECERLQGFPDGWTDIPNASDSARYKGLGNSVAIPCVEHVLRGVSYFLHRDGGGDDAGDA